MVDDGGSRRRGELRAGGGSFRQKVAGQKHGIGDHGRHHRAADDHGDQVGVIRAMQIGSCMMRATSLDATAVDSRLVVTRRGGINDFCCARIRERSSTSGSFQRDTRARGSNRERKANQAALR